MEKNNKKQLKVLYPIILVVAVLLSVFGTSIYYKKIYVGQNDYLLLNKVYDELDKNYYKDIDKSTLYAGAVKGMVEALDDPYSTYMTTEETDEFRLMLENEFVGIGVQVEQTPSGVYVTKVFEKSPAESVGISEGDIISTVDGESVLETPLDDLISMIRGPKGTNIEIGVKRAGEKEDLVFDVKREKIELEDLSYGLVGEDDSIGYIKINDFTDDIHIQFNDAYTDLKGKKIKSLIIDVRNNGGGYLDEVVKIVDMFVDDSKPIYQEKVKDEVTKKVSGNKSKEDIKVAVLINESSASASELLAASLSEINGSKLIGITTYGKGTAQTTKEYSNGSSLKYTFAQWLTPDGNWINDVGVSPDYEEELSDIYSYKKILISETLKFDQVSQQVINSQKSLVELGYKTRVDGYFGKDTQEAVKQFQTKNNLPVTGEVDIATANAINEQFQAHLSDQNNDNQIKKAIEVLSNE